MAFQGAKPNFLKHITLMLRPNTLAWLKDIKEIIKKLHSKEQCLYLTNSVARQVFTVKLATSEQ